MTTDDILRTLYTLEVNDVTNTFARLTENLQKGMLSPVEYFRLLNESITEAQVQKHIETKNEQDIVLALVEKAGFMARSLEDNREIGA